MRPITLKDTRTFSGMTPLDERSARRRDVYLTKHNIYKIHSSMPLAGFEPAIPASERPQTHASDRAATVLGLNADGLNAVHGYAGSQL